MTNKTFILLLILSLVSCETQDINPTEIQTEDFKSIKKEGIKIYKEKRYEDAIATFDRGRAQAEELGFIAIAADFLNSKGNVYYKLEKQLEAIECYEKSINYYISTGNQEQSVKPTLALGKIYRHLQFPDLAASYVSQGIKILQTQDDSKNLSVAYNAMSLIQKDLGNFNSSIEYEKKNLELKRKNNNHKGIILSLRNIGIRNLSLNKYDKSEEYLLKSLNFEKKLNNKKWQSDSYVKLGDLFFAQNKLKQAEEYYLKSYELRITTKYKKGIAFCEKKLGALYFKLGQTSKAEKHLITAIIKGREIKEYNLLKESHTLLSDLYRQEKKHRAAFYHKEKLNELREELIELEKIRSYNAQKIKYRLEDINRQFAKEKVKAKKAAKILKITYFSISILIAIFFFAVCLFYKDIKRNRLIKFLTDKNERSKETTAQLKTLLYDVHHRAKNNYQTVLSVISIAASEAKDEDQKIVLTEAANRVSTLMYVHREMAANVKGVKKDAILLKDYLYFIVDTLQINLGYLNILDWHIEADELYFEEEEAINLGIIVNELVSKVLLVSLKDHPAPELYIQMRKVKNKRHEFLLYSNGKNIPGDYDLIMQAFLQQMKAELTINFEEDLTCELNF